MPSLPVAQAFHDHLGGGSSPPAWNGIPIVGIDTIPNPPQNVEAFIVIQFPVANSDKPILGRRFTEEGAARIVLSIKEGMGMSIGLEWSDGIAALFREDQIADHIQTFAPSSPILDDSNDRGQWFKFAVIVPYRYQFDG